MEVVLSVLLSHSVHINLLGKKKKGHMLNTILSGKPPNSKNDYASLQFYRIVCISDFHVK